MFYNIKLHEKKTKLFNLMICPIKNLMYNFEIECLICKFYSLQTIYICTINIITAFFSKLKEEEEPCQNCSTLLDQIVQKCPNVIECWKNSVKLFMHCFCMYNIKISLLTIV